MSATDSAKISPIRICAGNPEDWLARFRAKKPLFACVLSFTQTGLLPGISAAGKTSQNRLTTAIADGEYLLSHTVSSPRTSALIQPLPPLSAGVSPAIISRAIIRQQKIPCCLLSTGLPARLHVPHIELPQVMARSIDSELAMTQAQVTQLWQSGLAWGNRLIKAYANTYLLIGECVVGGTTTAQALLSALGYSVAGLMSSSHADGNHTQKELIVSKALARWRQNGDFSALSAVAAVGDPMQVVVAGMAIAASRKVGVLLAGGSQMLAVYALIKAICMATGRAVSPQIVVGTTRWVVEDKSADTIAIARQIDAPYIASEISFAHSAYEQLRAYERGYIKEGVGAGGCAIAASLYKEWRRSHIRNAVEAELSESKILRRGFLR